MEDNTTDNIETTESVNEYQLFLQRAGIDSLEGLTPENLTSHLIEKNPELISNLVNEKSGSVKEEISGLLTNKLKKHLVNTFGVDGESLKELKDFETIIKTVGDQSRSKVSEVPNEELQNLTTKFNTAEASRRALEIRIEELTKEKESLASEYEDDYNSKVKSIKVDSIIQAQFKGSKLSDIVKAKSKDNLAILKAAVLNKYDVKQQPNGEFYVFNKDGSILYEEGATKQQTLENIVNAQITDLGWKKSEISINPLSPNSKNSRTSSSRKGYMNYPSRK